MISMVVGPPGAGKGLFLIRVIADILLETEQTIVTNFAVRVGELSRWLDGQGWKGDLHQRLYLLPDEDIKSFYLVRGPGRRIQAATAEQVRENVFQDYGPANAWGGVCYIMDEIDIHYGAREYKDHGRQVNFYNKQHRKLGDTCYYCCQSPAQIDKLFREVTEQTILLKNLGNRAWGLFKLPQWFMWSRYYRVPSLGPHSKSESQGVFKMPIREVWRAGERISLEKCFDTAAGVGLAGTTADKGKKRKGLSIAWLGIPVLLVALLVWNLPSLLAKGIGGVVGMGSKAASAAVAPMVEQAEAAAGGGGIVGMAAAVMGQKHPGQIGSLVPGSEAEKVVDEEAPVYLTGVSLFGGKARVCLSDGRVYTERDRELQWVSRHAVVIEGKRYTFAPLGN